MNFIEDSQRSVFLRRAQWLREMGGRIEIDVERDEYGREFIRLSDGFNGEKKKYLPDSIAKNRK